MSSEQNQQQGTFTEDEVVYHQFGNLTYSITSIETDYPAKVEFSDKPFVTESSKVNPFVRWLKRLFG